MGSAATNRQAEICRRVFNSRRTALVAASLGALLPILGPPRTARAGIFQWEYINPANPGQGKQQSTTLCPGGAGANAAPGANLSYHNLTKAYLVGPQLSPYTEWRSDCTYPSDLTGANLSQADLEGCAGEADTSRVDGRVGTATQAGRAADGGFRGATAGGTGRRLYAPRRTPKR